MRALLATACAALALGACARSEPADMPDNGANLASSVVTPSEPDPAAAAEPVGGDELVIAAVKTHLGSDHAPADNAKYLIGRADLDGDGDEDAIVYWVDPTMCGSGGCTAYVVTQEQDGMKVASAIGPAQLPIVALGKGADGWTDLGVSISGGGAKAALMRLQHGTDGYPRNPTVAPASEVTDGSGEKAQAIIADDFDKAKPIPND